MRTIVISALIGLVCLVLVELLFRLYLNHIADDRVFRTYATTDMLEGRYGVTRGNVYSSKYKPHRYLGYVPARDYREGSNRHNALGFRGAEVDPDPGLFNILALGGSTTYTSHVEDPADSYPAVLESLLNASGPRRYQVINAGAEGYSSYESLINLALRGLDLQPDLLLVYHGINDLQARFVLPATAYVGDNSGAYGPYGSKAPEPWWAASYVARTIAIKLDVLESAATLRNWFANHPDTFVGKTFHRQWRAGVYPQGILADTPMTEVLEINPPRFFERNLVSIVGMARAHSIEVALMTFAWSGGFDLPQVDSQPYQAGFAEQNALVRTTAERLGVLLIDLDAELSGRRELFTDGRHMNAEGVRVKAEHIARALRDSGLIKRATGQE